MDKSELDDLNKIYNEWEKEESLPLVHNKYDIYDILYYITFIMLYSKAKMKLKRELYINEFAYITLLHLHIFCFIFVFLKSN